MKPHTAPSPHAASPRPFNGPIKWTYRLPKFLPPPMASRARETWDAAANLFDQLFARRRGEYQQRKWAEQYRRDQEEARVRRLAAQRERARLRAARDDAYRIWFTERQAWDDLTLVAAIRNTYKKRPARRAARDNLARIIVQRAIEWADYRTPLIA
jgi:hypothetical protein